MSHNQRALILKILVDTIISAVGILGCHIMLLVTFGGPDRFMPYWCMIFIGLGCAMIFDDIEDYRNIKKPQ